MFILLSGCVVPKNGSEPASPVKRVTFRGVPEDEELRAEAVRIASEDFSKVREILGSGEDSDRKGRPFSIVIKRLWRPNSGPSGGYTAGSVIHLNPDYVRANPARLASILRHEMTHLLQRYAPGTPIYWREGICDYVAFKLSGDSAAERCECSGPFPHYSSGYGCAAAFLVYLEEISSREIVRPLHQALLQGNYSEQWFAEETGRDLADLWAGFQKTERFTVAARDRLILDEALRAPELPPGKAAEIFREFLVKQPGGRQMIEAGDYVRSLAAQGRLPGFNSEIPSMLVLESLDLLQTEEYPWTRTIRFISQTDGDRYVYQLVKESAATPWKLVDARRINERSGRIVKQYAL